MPSVIRIGCRVSSKVGPLTLVSPGAKRRTRSLFHGIVLSSGRDDYADKNKWKVLWIECGKCCDASASSLKLVALPVSNFDIKMYESLRECDYYETKKSFLEFVDKDSFTPNFEVDSNNIPSDETPTVPATSTGTSETDDNFAVETLLQLSASSSHGTSTNLLPIIDPSIDIVELTDNSEQNSQRTEDTSTPDNVTLNVVDDSDLFDPNSIVEEIIIHETGDKHTAARLKYVSEKEGEMGKAVKVKCGNLDPIEWTVVGDVKEANVAPIRNKHSEIGIKEFDFSKFEVWKGKYGRINLLHLLIHLWPGDWRSQLEEVNTILLDTERQGRRVKKKKPISENEFFVFFGVLLAARLEGKVGSMWENESTATDQMFSKVVNYTEYMSYTRFKDIRGVMSFVFQDKSKEGLDDWWMILGGINGFNENRKKVINAPNVKVLDETMSAFCPQTTKTGNLPHLSYIMRKPEPLGTEFKTCAAAKLGEFHYNMLSISTIILYILIYNLILTRYSIC